MVNVGGIIKDIEMFDAAFFAYSPKEAALIDPQQRLFWNVQKRHLKTQVTTQETLLVQ